MARLVVGIGQTVATTDPGDIVEMIGLGSCAGIFIAVPGRIALAAHCLLSVPPDTDRGSPPGKYVATAIPHLLERVARSGIPKSRFESWVVGGGQIFSFGGQSDSASIGARNTDLAVDLLRRGGLRPDQRHVGGTKARRATLQVGNGTFDSSVVNRTGA
jgi:chemotaxis receptor (MCP) glutamine deamidase CheD